MYKVTLSAETEWETRQSLVVIIELGSEDNKLVNDKAIELIMAMGYKDIKVNNIIDVGDRICING